MPVAAFGLKQYFDRSGRVSKTSDNEDATAALGNSEVLSVQHSPGEPITAFPQRPEDGTHCSPVGRHAPAGAGTSLDAVRDVRDKDLALPDFGESFADVLAGRAESAGVVEIPVVTADEAVVPGEVVSGSWLTFEPPLAASNSAPVENAGAFSGAGADGRQETGDVLKNEPAWAQFVGQPHDFPEQSRACAAQASAAACDGEILAREPSAKDSSPGNKSGCP